MKESVYLRMGEYLNENRLECWNFDERIFENKIKDILI